MDYEQDRYIKTGASSGYIPNNFITNEEYEYIIVTNDQSNESSGAIKRPPASKRLTYRKTPTQKRE